MKLLLLTFFMMASALLSCRENNPNNLSAATIEDANEKWIAIIPTVPRPKGLQGNKTTASAPSEAEEKIIAQGDASSPFGAPAVSADFDDSPLSSVAGRPVTAPTESIALTAAAEDTPDPFADLQASGGSWGVWFKKNLETEASKLDAGSERCWLPPEDASLRVRLNAYPQLVTTTKGAHEGYLVELKKPLANCQFQKGYIDSASVSAVSVLPQSKSDYDPGLGKLMGSAIGYVGQAFRSLCPGFSARNCYACVAEALKKALGDDKIAKFGSNDINKAPYYARYFAEFWSAKKWEPMLKLRRVFYLEQKERNREGFRTALERAKAAPVGSVIVWDKCGRSPAGHIAIVTRPGIARADFEAPIAATCGTTFEGLPRIIAVFTPIAL